MTLKTAYPKHNLFANNIAYKFLLSSFNIPQRNTLRISEYEKILTLHYVNPLKVFGTYINSFGFKFSSVVDLDFSFEIFLSSLLI